MNRVVKLVIAYSILIGKPQLNTEIIFLYMIHNNTYTFDGIFQNICSTITEIIIIIII